MDGNDANETEGSEVARWEYYDILGVEKNVTVDELRKKRKRLALRFHPDKNQGDDTAQFKMQQVNRAFEVLSDPMKKKVYDRFGEQALVQYENKTLSEDVWRLIFLFISERFVAFVGLGCLIVFSFVVLAPILLALKLDGTITSSWFLVTIPIFVIEAVLSGICILLAVLDLKLTMEEQEEEEMVGGDDTFLNEEKKKKLPFMKKVMLFNKLGYMLLFFFFHILLCAQLDTFIHWNWWFIFSPLLLLEITILSVQIPGATLEKYQERQTPLSPDVNFYCKLHYPGYLLRTFYTEVLFIVFTLFIIINVQYAPSTLPDDSGSIQGSGYVSWWLVCLPLFLWLFVRLSLSVVENIWYKNIKRQDLIVLEEAQQFEKEEEPTPIVRGIALCCTCFCISFLFLFIILLAGWLQASFHFSAMWLLSPLIVAACLLACVCVCCAFPIYGFCVYQHRSNDDFKVATEAPADANKPQKP